MPAAFPAVAAAYVRRLWPLLVVTAVPLLPAVLVGEAASLWGAADAVVVNGAVETRVDPGTGLWVLLGLALVTALAVAPVALGGVVLVAAGALLGRRVPVGAAWSRALRRYPTVLGWLLLMLVWAAVVLGLLFTGLFVLEFTPWPVLAVVVPPAVYSLAVLTVALPAALLEGHGTFRAVAVSWAMGRHRRASHVVFVGLAFGGGYLVNRAEERLATWAAHLPVDPYPVMVALALFGALLAPLWALLVTVPATLDSTGRPWTAHRDLDLAAADRELPGHVPEEAAPRAVPRGRALAVPALLALAVLVPTALTPVALWATDTPRVFTSPVEGLTNPEVTVAMAGRGDGALVTHAGRTVLASVCDPDCAPVGDGLWTRGAGAAPAGDAGFVYTNWREYRHEDDQNAPHEDSGLYLTECSGPDAVACSEGRPGTPLRHFGGDHYDTYSAVAPLDGGWVVASYVRPDPRTDELHGLDDVGGLAVHVCEDTACSAPTTVDVPGEIRVGGFLADGTLLDVAASPEGGFAVAAYDGAHGGVTLVHCPDTSCGEPEVTEVAPASLVNEYEDRLLSRFGARVEYRPDGTPVVAYRVAQGGAAHVVDCHDAACAEFTDRALTGPGWARPVPGLAVDSRGNPQLVTFDMADERVVLVSCLDPGCAETETVPLRDFTEEPALTALTLDEDDRPHLLWAQADPASWLREDRVVSEYVRCLDPLCGAAPGSADVSPGA
ncbi:hypothetical protein ABZ635_16885 [Nocardiopsis sp. NPDC007018]|uniref:hypothetical protein n=1 Tax=Nocardiopsis sp. NPDC007018 TaxID=3155721 RepID=UPI0033DBDF3E